MHGENRADFFLEFRHFQRGGLDRDQQNSDIPAVADAYQSRIADAVDLSDPIFDRGRRYLYAADIQHVVAAAEQQQFTRLRLTAQIAGLKPAVDETLRGESWIVEVTIHHRIGANADPAGLSGRDLEAQIVDDANFHARFQPRDIVIVDHGDRVGLI